MVDHGTEIIILYGILYIIVEEKQTEAEIIT